MTMTRVLLEQRDSGSGLHAKAHKHQHVAQRLREMIESLSPGDRLPSVTDLEGHFQVANSTIEAAMRLLSQERLIERRRGSGTYVSWRKQQSVTEPAPLRSGTARAKTGMIGVVAVSPPFLIVSDMMHSVEQELRRSGDSPVMILDMVDEPRIKIACQKVRDGIIDGFVHLGSTAVCIPNDVPAVILGETENNPDTWTVTVDNVQIGQNVASHFGELGHRRMGMITAAGSRLYATPRIKGYRDWLAEHGGECRDEWINCVEGYLGSFDHSQAVIQRHAEAMKRIMSGPDRPTAFFGVNDQVAILTVQILEDLGYRVPNDISVVGCDDSQGLRGVLRPALTTIKLPTESLGMVAVQMLRDRISQQSAGSGPMPVRSLRLSGPLVVRATTAPPPQD